MVIGKTVIDMNEPLFNVASPGKIIQRSFVALCFQVFAQILPVVVIPYLFIKLGATTFGHYAFALAIVQFAVLIGDWGLANSATAVLAKCSKNGHPVLKTFSEIVFGRFWLGLMLTVVVFIIGCMPVSYDVSLLKSLSFTILAFAINPLWFLQANDKAWLASLLLGIGRCVLLLNFFLVENSDDVFLAALFYSASAMLPAVLGWVYLSCIQQKPVWVPFRRSVSTMKFLAADFILSSSPQFFWALVPIVIGVVAGPIQLAYFSAAERVVRATQFISYSLAQVVSPQIAGLLKRSRYLLIRYLPNVRRVYLLLAFSMSASIVVISIFDTSAIFGTDYLSVNVILRALSLFPLLWTMNGFYSLQVILPLGGTTQCARMYLIVLPLGLMCVAISAYLFGAQAASWAAIVGLMCEFTFLVAVANKLCAKQSAPQMSGQPREVDILVALHNGAPWIVQQLDSLAQQSYQNFRIIVVDDASSDAGPELIRHHTLFQQGRIQLIEKSNNHGVVKTFEELIRLSKADFAFLADQDDWWLPNKIEIFVSEAVRLQHELGEDTPVFLHSDLVVVDEKLGMIHPSLWTYQHLQPVHAYNFSALLTQNVVTGCASMLNRALLNRVSRIPQGVIMHDYYLVLTAAAFGVVEHINQSTVLYRQHRKNTLGAQPYRPLIFFKDGLDRHRRKILQSLDAVSNQARILLDMFSNELSPAHKSACFALANIQSAGWFKKRYLIIRYGFWKVGFARNIALLLFV